MTSCFNNVFPQCCFGLSASQCERQQLSEKDSKADFLLCSPLTALKFSELAPFSID